VLDECLERIKREDEAVRRLFMRHAAALMDADGVQHPAEFDMILDLRERI
jgi:hypothetical protein